MLPWCRYGTGESFLFRFAPPDAAAQLLPAQALRQSLKGEELSVHRWARSGCDRFQRSEKASIAMGGSAGGGGGFAGLWIDADMATGTTEGSDTFGSEPLLAAADAGTPEARGSDGTQQLPPPSSVLYSYCEASSARVPPAFHGQTAHLCTHECRRRRHHCRLTACAF